MEMVQTEILLGLITGVCSIIVAYITHAFHKARKQTHNIPPLMSPKYENEVINKLSEIKEEMSNQTSLHEKQLAVFVSMERILYTLLTKTKD